MDLAGSPEVRGWVRSDLGPSRDMGTGDKGRCQRWRSAEPVSVSWQARRRVLLTSLCKRHCLCLQPQDRLACHPATPCFLNFLALHLGEVCDPRGSS